MSIKEKVSYGISKMINERNIYYYLPIFLLMEGCFGHPGHRESGILPVTAENIINETGAGNCLSWFDEQDTALIPVTRWETPGNDAYWPASMIIDWGKPVRINRIAIYDGILSDHNGTHYEHRGGTLDIMTGEPFQWKSVKEIPLGNSGQWKYINTDIATRYLRLLKRNTYIYHWQNLGPFNCDVNINEIVFFGFLPENDTVPDFSSNADIKAKYTVDEMIGVNTFCYDPPEYQKIFGMLREYQPWRWFGVQALPDSFRWTPSDNADPETFYRSFPGQVCVDLHRHVDEEHMGEARPDFGADPEDPDSYGLISDFFFQFAARFGHKCLPDSMLRVKGTEKPPTGTGWVGCMEAWNEPDRWWGSPRDHFTPYQLAAMASAVFDGHMGTMGSTFGARQADSSMQIVLAGLTSISPDYPKAIKLWADVHRKGSFPADVISFHHYCNSGGGQTNQAGVTGISPEADNLKARLQEIIRWRNRQLPEKEVWLTEFGWATRDDSPYSAIGHTLWPHRVNVAELQAIWLVRAYLAGAAAGIDRMFMFMLSDEPEAGPFKSCGLIDQHKQPKTSWYYVATLAHALKGMVFSGEIASGDPDVWIYRFTTPDDSRSAYVLWCPTSDGTGVNGFKLSVERSPKQAYLIELAPGLPEGKTSRLNLTHGNALVQVSERPVFILVDHPVNSVFAKPGL